MGAMGSSFFFMLISASRPIALWFDPAERTILLQMHQMEVLLTAIFSFF